MVAAPLHYLLIIFTSFHVPGQVLKGWKETQAGPREQGDGTKSKAETAEEGEGEEP